MVQKRQRGELYEVVSLMLVGILSVVVSIRLTRDHDI